MIDPSVLVASCALDLVERVIRDVGAEHLALEVQLHGLVELDVRERDVGALPVVSVALAEGGEERGDAERVVAPTRERDVTDLVDLQQEAESRHAEGVEGARP